MKKLLCRSAAVVKQTKYTFHSLGTAPAYATKFPLKSLRDVTDAVVPLWPQVQSSVQRSNRISRCTESKMDVRSQPATEVPAPTAEVAVESPKTKAVKVKRVKEKKTVDTSADDAAGREVLGITAKKEENFSEWYTQVISRADMVEYYDVSGCYILRPWSFFIWESIQDFMNERIKKIGVQNAYFPMFVSKSKLEAEENHLEGFSPEVAWVTKYGSADLGEPIAIRPTSETIMYPAFAKWIRSHRDLPLKLNQWCQVVRWEFKQPTPFIRTREFLWQEGHTAHASDAEATEMVLDALEIYRQTYEELLAVPVIKGTKSEKEKFAGAKMTTTVETAIAVNGRGIQAATSHHLGTNFSSMFNIEFENQAKEKQLAHQTSWGLSTRSLGVVIMTHGDDKGMVMPPRVAPLQVIVIPIVYKKETDLLLNKCKELVDALNKAGIRTQLDDRDTYTPGWKFNHWEVKGVCIRLEMGPKDMQNNTARLVRRDTGTKTDVAQAELVERISSMLEDMHKDMLDRARANLDNMIVKVTDWKDVMPALNARKLILAPWCEEPESEEQIKAETSRLSQEAVQEDPATTALTGAMKTLCIPMVQEPLPAGAKCFFTGKPAKRWCLWGRSY